MNVASIQFSSKYRCRGHKSFLYLHQHKIFPCVLAPNPPQIRGGPRRISKFFIPTDTSLFVIDRGEKRAAWVDEDEDNSLVELAKGNRNKKLRGEGELTGGQLEIKLRTQVRFST